MKFCRGWVMSAGLLLAATSANAQTMVPADGYGPRYSAVSDFEGPYAAMPPGAPGYGPRLLPAPEIYTVLRDNGFSPLGAPHQRGFFYSIAVLDRGGGEGRLVIDARDGRIVRYMQGYPDVVAYGPPAEPPPVISAVRGPPRPPASVPHVASRTPGVPLPRAMPQRSDGPQTVGKASETARISDKASDKVSEPAKPSDAKSSDAKSSGAKPSEPAPQSVAQARPAAVPATPPAVIEAKPETKTTPQIQTTKEMPKVQGLE
jgi:hypothetical protein